MSWTISKRQYERRTKNFGGRNLTKRGIEDAAELMARAAADMEQAQLLLRGANPKSNDGVRWLRHQQAARLRRRVQRLVKSSREVAAGLDSIE